MLVVFGTPVAFATTGLLHLVAWPSGSEIETSTRLRDRATLASPARSRTRPRLVSCSAAVSSSLRMR
jgi:hypothetical protein